MTTYKINRKEIFKNKKVLKYYPENIEVQAEIKEVDSDVDIVIGAYGNPDMTNATIKNYLNKEQQASIHIYLVESSGDSSVKNAISKHPNVSRIFFTKDYKVKYGRLGYASPGLALTFAVGTYFTQAPHIFYSHNDMMAYKENFITFLMSKLKGRIRIASFTQRHIIPFTGCMMMKREMLLNEGIDWAPVSRNYFIPGRSYPQHPLRYLSRKKMLARFKRFPKSLRWIDCGEAFIYNEIQQGNPLYVCASIGGKYDYGKNPFAYFEASSQEVRQELKTINFPVQYQAKYPDKEILARFYPEAIPQEGKYWRYCFDDNEDLIFIHHGRGTGRAELNNWLNFVKQHGI